MPVLLSRLFLILCVCLHRSFKVFSFSLRFSSAYNCHHHSVYDMCVVCMRDCNLFSQACTRARARLWTDAKFGKHTHGTFFFHKANHLFWMWSNLHTRQVPGAAIAKACPTHRHTCRTERYMWYKIAVQCKGDCVEYILPPLSFFLSFSASYPFFEFFDSVSQLASQSSPLAAVVYDHHPNSQR